MAFWDKLHRQLLAPKVNEEEAARALEIARQSLPAPIIWLLGKSQAGKTSIIRGLTGAEHTEIGGGFRPCTRTSEIYDFPTKVEPIVRFLDTRGLGEASYDPQEDINLCQEQAHLVLLVVRAMDHALAPLIEPLREIRRKHPRWPIIVAQTCLHDGYSSRDMQHPLPYPYDKWPPREVPTDLVRSLQSQRDVLSEFTDRFVAIDFTLPDDGYLETLYGVEALWNAIEDAHPHGLRAILSESPEIHQDWSAGRMRLAQRQILSYSVAAGVLAATPLPLVEAPLVLAVHAKMFHSLGSIYGQKITASTIAEISGTLGMGYMARLAGRSMMKLVPGVGSVAASVTTGSATYALGRSICYYFTTVQDGNVPDAKTLRRIYAEQFQEGRRRLGSYLKQAPETPPPTEDHNHVEE